MTERLTTLAAVKDWLDIAEDNTDSDGLLTRVIISASQYVLNYMSRDAFAATDFTYNFKGNGKDRQLLRNWPILSVTSVGVLGVSIPTAEDPGLGNFRNGFRVSTLQGGPQAIELYNCCFNYRVPCQVIYRAGFETMETSILEDGIAVTPSTGGLWTTDQGVTIDGTPGVKVDADPATGEYSVDEWGSYSFSSADAGKTAVISYSYCPFDVSQSVTELIGEWFRRKDRIGLLSKTLGGQETISFSQKDMNGSIRDTLDWYTSVVPM